MSDWFMSDPHFGHRNILKFDAGKYRPYAEVGEMNEAIVLNVNSLVKHTDTLYILGDIAFNSQYQYLKRLAGRKIIVILGNHDYPNKVPSILEDSRVVVAGCLEYKRCILTHIPVHESQKYRYRANIHGHLHSNKVLDRNGNPDPFYYNAGLELQDMKPRLWSEIAKGLKLKG